MKKDTNNKYYALKFEEQIEGTAINKKNNKAIIETKITLIHEEEPIFIMIILGKLKII